MIWLFFIVLQAAFGTIFCFIYNDIDVTAIYLAEIHVP